MQTRTQTAVSLTAALALGLTMQSAEGAVIVNITEVELTGLNPRTTFDPQALKELAISIFEKTVLAPDGTVLQSGVQQPLIARLKDGKIQIVAGERRYRAVQLLQQGFDIQVADGVDENNRLKTTDRHIQVPLDYPLPVLLHDLTDAQVLDFAVTENLIRDDMSYLDVCDSALNLKAKGYSLTEIANKLGKTPKEIVDMQTFASGLGQEGRRLFREGRISKESAAIISEATGELKKALLEQARVHDNPTTLRSLRKRAAFVVSDARFDVAASGLSIDEGLGLGGLPPRFTNPRAALEHQLTWAEQHKQTLEQGGKRVSVVMQEDAQYSYEVSGWKREYGSEYADLSHSLILINPVTGQVREGDHYVPQSEWEERHRELRKAGKASAPTEASAGIRDAARRIAHQARAQSIDATLAGNPRECMIAAIYSLARTFVAQVSYEYAPLMALSITKRREVPVTPESQTLLSRLAARFPGIFPQGEKGIRIRLDDLRSTLRGQAVTDQDLMELFALFTHNSAAHWDSDKTNQVRGLRGYAQEIGADQDLKVRFTLTQEYLDAYTFPELVQLIQTMPQALRPAQKVSGKKEMVARILEKAPALKEAGWLPELVQYQ